MSTAIEAKPYLDGLKAADRSLVQRKTKRIRDLTKRTAEGVYLIGRELIQVKAVLEHGRFLDWMQDEFEWSERTAERFINVALKLQKPYENRQFVEFAPSALYLLTAPSTPEVLLEQAQAEAASGKKVTHARAKQLVNESRQAAQEAFDGLTTEHQEDVQRGMVKDTRKQKLAAIERHLDAARKLIEGEPDIAESALEHLELCRVQCQFALAG